VTINARIKGTVNSRPLWDLKILGGQSGYLTEEKVSQNEKSAMRTKPTMRGASTEALVAFLYCSKVK